ncbi:hypothetical protein NQZ68_031292 [Dissostichus eleginoides]|nr:hypothetical protein NQZ68_031292 [Dissostichus eleginoides]
MVCSPAGVLLEVPSVRGAADRRLFWDCAARCIPALILETRERVWDSWTPDKWLSVTDCLSGHSLPPHPPRCGRARPGNPSEDNICHL